MQAQRGASDVTVAGIDPIPGATRGDQRAIRVRGAPPMHLLAEAAEQLMGEGGVALVGAGQCVDLRLHVRIPVGIGVRAVGVVVVGGVGLDHRVDLGGANQDLRPEQPAGDARGVEVLGLVLRVILATLAGNLLAVVRQSVEESWRGQSLAGVALGIANHGGMDGLLLCRVLFGGPCHADGVANGNRHGEEKHTHRRGRDDLDERGTGMAGDSLHFSQTIRMSCKSPCKYFVKKGACPGIRCPSPWTLATRSSPNSSSATAARSSLGSTCSLSSLMLRNPWPWPWWKRRARRAVIRT